MRVRKPQLLKQKLIRIKVGQEFVLIIAGKVIKREFIKILKDLTIIIVK